MAGGKEQTGLQKTLRKLMKGNISTVIALIVLCLIFGLLSPYFFTFTNIMNIGSALTAVAGGFLALVRGFDLGGLAAYLLYTRQVGRPIEQMGQQVNTILSALAGAERIFEVMDTCPEVDEGSVTLVAAEKDANGSLSAFSGAGRPRT